jgi:putative membrane protein
MVVPSLIAALHYLALALGVGSVFARGLRLRQLRRSPTDGEATRRLLQADAGWGVAALMWIVTGLVRVFAGVEKASEFYLRNGFFYTKMGLFVVVLVLELFPMVTFIRWRKALGKGAAPAAGAPIATLIRLNDLEVAIVVVMVFVAAMMARGVWLF